MDAHKMQFVHFKNGIFHGCVQNDRREGEAICLYDNGAIFIGHFKADQPSGKCVIILWPNTYFIGSLSKGMLEGNFTVRSPHLHIYSQTIMNRIQGEVVAIDCENKRARVWEIKNSQGVCIRQADYQDHLGEDKILRAVSPYTEFFPSLLDYFLLNNQPSKLTVKSTKLKDKIDICLQDIILRKLTVQLERERLSAAGVMEFGQIVGFGYLYDRYQGVQLEGEIFNGVIDGEGLKRDLGTGRTIFGKFAKGDIRTLDIMDNKRDSADTSLVAFKKKVHLHSLQFTNDYLNERIIYLLRNFYEMIAENEVKYTKYLKGSKGEKQAGEGLNVLRLTRQLSNDELGYNINQYNMLKNALTRR